MTFIKISIKILRINIIKISIKILIFIISTNIDYKKNLVMKVLYMLVFIICWDFDKLYLGLLVYFFAVRIPQWLYIFVFGN